jgi:hypothetical protein
VNTIHIHGNHSNCTKIARVFAMETSSPHIQTLRVSDMLKSTKFRKYRGLSAPNSKNVENAHNASAGKLKRDESGDGSTSNHQDRGLPKKVDGKGGGEEKSVVRMKLASRGTKLSSKKDGRDDVQQNSREEKKRSRPTISNNDSVQLSQNKIDVKTHEGPRDLRQNAELPSKKESRDDVQQNIRKKKRVQHLQ